MRKVSLLALAVAVALGAALLGNADPAVAAEPGNYVGTVHGTDAFISVVIGNESAVAYACDSKKIYQGFIGDVTGDVLTLGGMDGPGDAKVHVSKSVVSGTVELDGVVRRFTARLAPATAGYFYALGRARDAEVMARWVVAANGAIRGAVLNRNTGDIVAFETGVDLGLPFVIIIDTKVNARRVVPQIGVKVSVERRSRSNLGAVSVDSLRQASTRY